MPDMIDNPMKSKFMIIPDSYLSENISSNVIFKFLMELPSPILSVQNPDIKSFGCGSYKTVIFITPLHSIKKLINII